MSLEMLEKSDLAGVSLFAPFSGRSGFYLSGRPTSWGWITCRNSWPGNEMSYDWFVLNWKSMKIFDKINMFILLGLDLYRMGNRAVAKSNDSWFIRYVLYSYIRGYKFITPGFSLVENFGTEMSPTHGSKKPFPFYTPLLIFNSINRINMNRLYRIFVTLQYTRLVKACISISKKYVKVYFSKRG